MDLMQSLMHCFTITRTGVLSARCWWPQMAEKYAEREGRHLPSPTQGQVRLDSGIVGWVNAPSQHVVVQQLQGLLPIVVAPVHRLCC